MSKLKQAVDDIVNDKVKSLIVVYSLTFLSFINIFQNKFVYDDPNFVVKGPIVKPLSRFWKYFVIDDPEYFQGIYAPLKTLFHGLAYQLFGENVFLHHALSLLIHFCAIWFVYQIIEVVTKNKRVAFFSTLLFSLHPVHGEAIALITQSIDSIGSVFLLVSFYLYIKGAAFSKEINRKVYLFSLVFFVFAISSRELTASLPFLIVWYELSLNRGKGDLKCAVKRSLPYFFIVVSYLICKYWMLGVISRGEYIYGSFYLTMLISIKALAKYIIILFAPLLLTINHVISEGIYSYSFYDFEKQAVLSQSILDVQIFASVFIVGICLYVMISCLKNKPQISFGIGWFFFSLLPALNIIPCGVFLAERYLYFASMGFFLIVGIFFEKLYMSKKRFCNLEGFVLANALIVFVCFVYGVKRFQRNGELRNEVTFYESAVRANPQSAKMKKKLKEALLEDSKGL